MSFEEVLFCSLRLLLALVLGFAIGFERKMRSKEAGVRTHTIVCVGACLYMIISTNIVGADPSRIAAQIVSGIGFIGAGMIFYNKQVVHGLTTAAGIWATAAIGMAVGAGLWELSIVASIIIVLVQFIMHLPFKFFHMRHFFKLNVVFEGKDGSEKDKILKLFNVNRFAKISVKKENNKIIYSTVINSEDEFSADKIYNALNDYDFIISITREDTDF